MMWKPNGELKIINLGTDFFLVKFGIWADRDRVLNEGPWSIYGHFLSVREWTPAFNPVAARIERAVVWVRIPALPIEFYHRDCLGKIGNKLGKLIKLDIDTESQEKGRYARICIEIDLTKSRIDKFNLNGRIFKVEYEGLRLVCFECGRVGHRREDIPSVARQKGGEEATATDGVKMALVTKEVATGARRGTQKQNGGGSTDRGSDSSPEDALHGPWMTMKPRRRPMGQHTVTGLTGGHFNGLKPKGRERAALAMG